ncbi:MAG: hypothetical protein ACQCN4_08790 [Candidatus Bathyarchaeia archaeon]|jgi:hypothetical protein
MSLFKKKMLITPILAVTLALLLAGSVSFLPQNPSQNQPLPEPTSYDKAPLPLPTSPPVAQAMAPLNGNLVSILFSVAAVVVGIVVACLLFSERKLKKELHER